jgi:bifunctional DNA-binding transcriptional regulator/antitoxin component of YhaV-PrlF toxin-antitoxin module
MKKFNLKNYLFNFLVVLFIASFIMPLTPTVAVGSMAIAFTTGTALSFVKNVGFNMAIQVEIWQKVIEEELFKDNEFLRASHKADGSVIDSKIVHIPQSGGSGNVEKNRTTIPANVRKRTDTDIVYVLDEYTTDPALIPNADKHELSYNKVVSVLGEDMDNLKEFVAEETIYSWLTSTAVTGYGATALPSASVLETSGDAAPSTAPASTGNRKKITKTDFQKAKTFLKKQKRWINGRMYAMITPEMEADLFPADDLASITAMNQVSEKERREGVMYTLQGFKIFVRNTVVRLDNAGTIKTPEAVGAATDDDAALFWYEKAVEFAYGTTKAFQDLDDPRYYGDIYSFLVRAGARARRVGYEGICLIKQAKTA